MHLHHIVSPLLIRFVVFPLRDSQFLVYSQVHDVWVFVIRGDLMIEDNVYSIDRHIHQFCAHRLRVFRRVFITGDVPVAADWVGHHVGGQSRSEETGGYLSGNFNAGWVADAGFLEEANRSPYR
jgi:hypothetical protein